MMHREEHCLLIAKILPTKRKHGAFDKFSPWCQYLFAIHFCVRSPCEEEMERGNSEKQ